MRAFLKHLAVAFFAQIGTIISLIFLVELTSIELFWRILLQLYVFPAVAVIKTLTGSSETDVFLGIIPLVIFYSLILAVLYLVGKRLKREFKNDSS